MKYISPVGYDNTIFQKYKFYFPNLLKYLFFFPQFSRWGFRYIFSAHWGTGDVHTSKPNKSGMMKLSVFHDPQLNTNGLFFKNNGTLKTNNRSKQKRKKWNKKEIETKNCQVREISSIRPCFPHSSALWMMRAQLWPAEMSSVKHFNSVWVQSIHWRD